MKPPLHPTAPPPALLLPPLLPPLLLLLLLLITLPVPAGEFRLELVPESAMKLLGGYAPQRLALDPAAPPTVKRGPAGLKPSDARYGTLVFGPAEARTSILVVTEEPAAGPARCWVDANANGDLTDDPAVEWTSKPYTSRAGDALAMHSGGSPITARHAGQELAVQLQFYRFDARDPDRAALKDTMLYFGDYARRGTVRLGDREVPALLADDRATGDFRGQADSGNGSGIRLALDLNGDGTFDRRPWESFDVRQPFTVGATTWEIRDLAWNGASLRIDKSSRTVDEVKAPPSTEVGKAFPPFTARTLADREVKFPESFKGRLVLLDFWATWCGPCIAELPNLKAAYTEFHDRGVDVLGVSLDDTDAKAKVEAFARKHQVAWDQIYEGGGWQTRLAREYGIDSIPRVFLVDGDSGLILALTRDLRGPALADTLRKALAEKASRADK